MIASRRFLEFRPGSPHHADMRLQHMIQAHNTDVWVRKEQGFK